ncbi:MAG TPA: CBS domain-containing protein [Longimicrobiales bacterium]|nr:CBS domain-containing protein [Longimicrobiales bacterium]
MRVRDLVGGGRKVITIEPGAPLSEAMDLLLSHEIGALPVVGSDGSAVGLLSERDVVRAVHGAAGPVASLPVSRAMRRPPPTCDLEDSLLAVTARMTRERARHLVVCDRGKLAAVLSVGDLVKHRLEQLETETGVLRDYLVGQRARV